MQPLDSRLHPAFAMALEGIDVERLDRDSATIYGLFPDMTLGYYNPAWTRFAELPLLDTTQLPVSHGLCETCFTYYYPEGPRRSTHPPFR